MAASVTMERIKQLATFLMTRNATTITTRANT